MSYQTFIRRKVETARDQYWYLTVGLPCSAKTSGQRKLKAKHGTPTEFARGCVASLGEISVQEAKDAISKYLKEWIEA